MRQSDTDNAQKIVDRTHDEAQPQRQQQGEQFPGNIPFHQPKSRSHSPVLSRA